MAKVYDPILCMMVDKPDKAQDELSLAQKKQVVTELKGFLKKSYNFGDESEYARAYEDLRHMFTTGSRKSISGLFENTVKKTGAKDAKAKDELKIVKEDGLWCVYKDGKQVGQSNSEAGAIRIYNRLESAKDSASALDEAIKTADGATGDKLYADVKAIYNIFSNILLTYTNEQSVQRLANEGTKKCLELAAKVKGVRDEAIKTADESTYKVEYSDIPGSKKNYAYVKANSENEAANKVKGVVYSVKIVDSKTIDEAIKVRDASTGHKVVVFVENYLRSIGKNNSTGKYDRIVQGVRSLLSQSLLDDEGLKKAAEHEADRLLKKYNL